MNIDDIRLTKEELHKIMDEVEPNRNAPITASLVIDLLIAASDTATDKAVKKIRSEIWDAIKNCEYITIGHPLYDILKDLNDMVES